MGILRLDCPDRPKLSSGGPRRETVKSKNQHRGHRLLRRLLCYLTPLVGARPGSRNKPRAADEAKTSRNQIAARPPAPFDLGRYPGTGRGAGGREGAVEPVKLLVSRCVRQPVFWESRESPLLPTVQAVILREVLGDPFRPVPINPAWRTLDRVVPSSGCLPRTHPPRRQPSTLTTSPSCPTPSKMLVARTQRSWATCEGRTSCERVLGWWTRCWGRGKHRGQVVPGWEVQQKILRLAAWKAAAKRNPCYRVRG